MYESYKIAERIKSVTESQKIIIKKMLSDISLGANTMSNMKTSFPKADNLAKIADYLNCSVDYLLGRECNVNNLSSEEKELLEEFKKLDFKGKTAVMQTILSEQKRIEQIGNKEKNTTTAV